MQPGGGRTASLGLAAVSFACGLHVLDTAGGDQGLHSWACFVSSAFVSMLTRDTSSLCSAMHATAHQHRDWLALLWLVSYVFTHGRVNNHASAEHLEYTTDHWKVKHVFSLP